MKKFYLSVAAIAALITVPAMAADIPARAPITRAPVAVSPAYNWTGFYSASSIGGAWWNVDGTYVAPPPDRHNTSGTRAVYGSSYGAQLQWNNWVVGVEGGFNTILNSDYESSLSSSADCLGATPIANRTCESRIRNYWQAGGRLGYAWDNWMAYATGGYANGRIESRVLVTSTPTILTSYTSERHGGWYAGGGVEVFIGRWFWSDTILGLEYQHVEFETLRHLDRLLVVANNRDMDASMDVVRARLIFKFTPGGAITAAY